MPLPVLTPATRLSWRQADDTVWVATCGGEFAGTIAIDDDGLYQVSDRIARPVLTTTSWVSAVAALDAVPASATPARPRRRRRRSSARPAGR